MRTIGIDLGIRKVAWSVWDDDVLIATEAYESTRSLRHEQLCDTGTVMMTRVMTDEPDQIFIEDTLIGNNRKYSIQLSQMMGAVLSAIGVCTQTSFLSHKHIPVVPVNVSTWKREVIGNGRADKKAVRDYLWSLDSAYSVLCGHDQDRFDAAAIGYYGYIVSKRAEALAKSGFSYSEDGS